MSKSVAKQRRSPAQTSRHSSKDHISNQREPTGLGGMIPWNELRFAWKCHLAPVMSHTAQKDRSNGAVHRSAVRNADAPNRCVEEVKYGVKLSYRQALNMFHYNKKA